MPLYQKIIKFYQELSLEGVELPEGIKAMNPYKGDGSDITNNILHNFYHKFYNVENARHLILGINPGRFGAGKTGLMFTDTIRLNQNCGIVFNAFHSRELSSEFFYRVVEELGGTKKFYGSFYIGAVSPLGYIKEKENGKTVNYNYYDSKQLEKALLPFIENSLKKQLAFNIETDKCFCLGTGKNYKFLTELNKRLSLFKQIIPLEHPRFILQYKRKELDFYIEKYIRELKL